MNKNVKCFYYVLYFFFYFIQYCCCCIARSLILIYDAVAMASGDDTNATLF